MRMKSQIITTVLFLPIILCASQGSPKDAIAGRLVNGCGVTFLNKAEILTIMTCTEQKSFKTPSDQNAAWAAAKQCIITNCLNKGVQAMSLFNNFNTCLKNGGSSIDTFANKIQNRVTEMTQNVTDKAFKQTAKCKTGCAAPDSTECLNQCMNKFYNILKQIVNKPYFDEICCETAENDFTVSEYKCVQASAPKVINISGYKCATLQKTLAFFRLFHNDKNDNNFHGNFSDE